METIIAALISALSAIVVCVISANSNHKKIIAVLDKHDGMHEYRLSQLEKKVDKHNHLIERQYDIEKITAVLSEDLKVANHRIDDLEREVQKR